ncbi:MAG: AI-2E family transporter, partial [Euzebyales bacterium]|nr:AI-2E family transporter [Euzebyales bacterium]
LTLAGSLLLVVGSLALLAPTVSAQVGDLGAQASQGVEQIKRFLASGPFGLDPVRLDELVDRGREALRRQAGSGLASGVLGAVAAVAEGVAGLLFGLVALFFYLKDGERIGRWLRDLLPRRMRSDAQEVGVRAWQTIGAYIRGQLVIATVDAVLIGGALLVLGVPLALPLSLLVFVGGLLPLVGAFVSGALAVLVALASNGPTAALILFAWIVVVQQLEGDLLAPVVLGRATALHPLATLVALTAGAVLLGVLGAFLAIPLTASAARGAGYLRGRHGDPAVGESAAPG